VKFIRSLYLNNRFFIVVAGLAVLFIASFILGVSAIYSQLFFLLALAVLLTDLIFLYRTRKGLSGHRFTPEKLSNGDENELRIYLQNFYPFAIHVRLIDEIPHQFQKRDLNFYISIESGDNKVVQYFLRPVKRGEYSFGAVNAFVSSPIGLIARRFRYSQNKMVPVYPSYIQMRKYELLAISNRLSETGVKKIRRIGHNMEFELIKEYVTGDDFRTVNWKATARRNHLMVNQYQDERSQQVYSLIDKGRVMQMPFDGMTLLDYAINAALVISNIAIKKSDKAGVLTFQDKIGALLPASRNSNQMGKILEMLYKQKTAFRETDFSIVYNHIRRKISQRSLLILYTNFESVNGLHRQLQYLKGLANLHLVVVVFFENTEMKSLLERPADDLRAVYHKAIAEKLSLEKKLIIKELTKNGIQAVLTTPQKLTVDTLNKYLELKSRGWI
jgi:uncharacterized protein (DUF58 family)